jgi:hypothetical protein
MGRRMRDRENMGGRFCRPDIGGEVITPYLLSYQEIFGTRILPQALKPMISRLKRATKN